jgi:hypothetical protein
MEPVLARLVQLVLILATRKVLHSVCHVLLESTLVTMVPLLAMIAMPDTTATRQVL